MKTIPFAMLLSAILFGCSKEMATGPDREASAQLAKKTNGVAVALYKEGLLLDEAETDFSGNPIGSALETFDRDLTISFYESGAYWQVSHVKKQKPDTLFISVLHKEQAWCSHCSYYNGHYSISVESKVQGTLIDRTLAVSTPLNKKKAVTYSYTVTDDSEQNNRFIIVLK